MAPPLTEQAADLERIWDVFLIIAAGVGALVAGLVVFVVMRNRRRGDLPRQQREHIPLELAYTVIPLLIVAGLFAITVGSVRAVDDLDDPDAVDLVVDVVGFQWQWQFTYPESAAGGELVITGTEQEVPELVLPASSTVRFDLRAVDVIHSFWIPGFRFKRDMFPGEETSFQVDVAGTTGAWADTGVCAEFCGLDHHRMRFSVRIVSPEDFAEWRRSESTVNE
ncbi:MAG: cytochrome c oxidase subunit II [Actinomycetota bacterium]|nr:cytochrome c oxidase subunit II [Actinomycetota bacterium]